MSLSYDGSDEARNRIRSALDRAVQQRQRLGIAISVPRRLRISLALGSLQVDTPCLSEREIEQALETELRDFVEEVRADRPLMLGDRR